MVPVYRSDGEPIAVIHLGGLYNIDGEWVGDLRGQEVYGINGEYVGFISQDHRLLRARRPPDRPAITPPAVPPRLRGIPVRFPLAPLFKQLPYDVIDVFEENPERFKYVSELRPDMD